MRDADSDVPLPDDSFLGSLKRLAEIMTKVTKQVYRPKSQSLSACLHAAISIYGELRALTLDIQKDFGLALEHLTTTDPHGPRETTLVTCKFWPNLRNQLSKVGANKSAHRLPSDKAATLSSIRDDSWKVEA